MENEREDASQSLNEDEQKVHDLSEELTETKNCLEISNKRVLQLENNART